MKKHVFIVAAVLAVFVSAYAQNEHIHIFYNIKDFTTLKGSDILSITHEVNGSGELSQMVVNSVDGKSNYIDLSTIDSVQIRPTGLPKFHVKLQDYPLWNELTGSKDDVHPATITMDGNGMYEDLKEQTVEFRGRGNTTWYMPKKPYRFKMDKKASVCGLTKAKTFVLIANFIDCSLMRNASALWVANWLEMPYSNHCVPVEVELNDRYKGTYMLTEKIGIGGGSVDIDETKGVLFELDANYDEAFRFKYQGTGVTTGSITLPVMIKDPDFEEICPTLGVTTAEYLASWQKDFTDMANAVVKRSASESLADVLDLDQATDYFLVNSVANNHEMKHPKSMYLYKEALGSEYVYKFGPVWDFDWAYSYDGGEGASPTIPLVKYNGNYSGASFCKEIFKNEEFRKLYKEKWDRFMNEGYPALLKYIDDYAALIEPSAKMNGLTWEAAVKSYGGGVKSSWEFRENLITFKTWLQQRVEYCNSHPNWGLY